MRRYFRIFTLYFQHVLQYRAASFIWFLVAFINPFILLLFWRGALAHTNSIRGWAPNTILTYYLLLMLAQSLLMHHVEIVVAHTDIKEGELVRELLKPFSYLTMRFLGETPWRLTQAVYGIVTIVIALFFLHKEVAFAVSGSTILGAVFVIVLAFALSFFFKMILGILAFWFTNIDSLLEVNDVFLLVFTGMLIPINLFPQWMQNVANATPYPYIIYYPIISLIRPMSLEALLQISLIQISWITFFFVLYQINCVTDFSANPNG